MSCVPIILFSPSDSTLRGYDTERVVQQADIMPTVLNYLGYDIPYFAFGQDMLNTPADQTIAMHWVPEVDGYEFVKGNYAIEFDGNHVTHAYHYRTDSTLQHNVLRTMPQDTLSQMERQMKAFIQSYMYRMNNNKLTVEE
jgi:arylsulfatase A-like enzyme